MARYRVVDRSLGLVRSIKTGILYFRKHVTAAGGRAEISLRTRDEAEARRIIFRTYSQFLKTPPPEAHSVTIDEIIVELYEINQGKAKATFENFEIHCRLHLLPFFTNYRIKDVAKAWPLYVAHQHKKNPNRQLSHDRRHLITILNRAVERGDLDGLPKLQLDRAKRIKGPIELYSRAEVSLILSTTAEDLRQRYPDNREYWFREKTLEDLKLKFELGLFSGLRLPTEASSLRYSWIDFETGIVRIPAQAIKTRTHRIAVLDTHILQKLKERRVFSKTDCVFPRRGNPTEPATRSDKTWQRFKKALGITKKLYWSRHTHASEAVRHLSPSKVKKTMGTSLEMFDRVYDIPADEDRALQSTVVRRAFCGEIGELDGNSQQK